MKSTSVIKCPPGAPDIEIGTLPEEDGRWHGDKFWNAGAVRVVRVRERLFLYWRTTDDHQLGELILSTPAEDVPELVMAMLAAAE